MEKLKQTFPFCPIGIDITNSKRIREPYQCWRKDSYISTELFATGFPHIPRPESSPKGEGLLRLPPGTDISHGIVIEQKNNHRRVIKLAAN